MLFKFPAIVGLLSCISFLLTRQQFGLRLSKSSNPSSHEIPKALNTVLCISESFQFRARLILYKLFMNSKTQRQSKLTNLLNRLDNFSLPFAFCLSKLLLATIDARYCTFNLSKPGLSSTCLSCPPSADFDIFDSLISSYARLSYCKAEPSALVKSCSNFYGSLRAQLII